MAIVEDIDLFGFVMEKLFKLITIFFLRVQCYINYGKMLNEM
jgi:hypothetical protein